MDYQKKVLEHYNIELTEDTYNSMADLSVYKNLTADGYEIWMINHVGGLDYDHKTDWEHDVYMYNETIPDYLFSLMKDRQDEQWFIDGIDEIFENYHWADEYEKIIGDDENEEPDVVEDKSGVEILLNLADERHKR